MADSKPIRLSAVRFASLCAYIKQHYDRDPIPDVPCEITVFEPTEVGGILFLPARYIGPDEADPMPAEPPLKPAPAPAYL